MPYRLKTHKPPRFTHQSDKRPSATARGYGVAWRIIRANHLAIEPLCRECRKEGRLTPAVHVDHIKAKPEGTDDEENLQSLCHHHHSVKTAKEDGGFGRKRKKPSGSVLP